MLHHALNPSGSHTHCPFGEELMGFSTGIWLLLNTGLSWHVLAVAEGLLSGEVSAFAAVILEEAVRDAL